MNTSNHVDYMLMALSLAERGRQTVSPNPMVGCVLVQNNQVVGQGFHQRAGEPHAEIYALQDAGTQSKGAVAYITLEPCCHHGRTGPCTEALIQAGIKKVYVACTDPNPLVAGKGIESLRFAGIEVEVGLCEQQAKQLNEIFFYYITRKRPFVIAKWAMSLDGRMNVNGHDDRKISSAESHYHTHQMRQQVDAILIGANTLRNDNPQLTARLNENNEPILKQPVRIILSSQGNLPLNSSIFAPNFPGKTIIATTVSVADHWCKTLCAQNNNIEILTLAKTSRGQVDLHSLLDELAKRSISSILVEGGMQVHHSFFEENLVNKIQVYISPVIIASLEKKRPIINFECTPISTDFYVTGHLRETENV